MTGLCGCGCGERTSIAPRTVTSRGRFKGKHMRFVKGHNQRGVVGADHSQWRGDAAKHSSVHTWLRRYYPKAGACETCGTVGPTDYAFLGAVGDWARDREQYVEECRSCHSRRDGAGDHFNTFPGRV